MSTETFDLITYDLFPRSVGQFFASFMPLVSVPGQPGILAGWKVEIGPLNQIVQIWSPGSAELPDAAAAHVKSRSTVRLQSFDFSPPLRSALAAATDSYFDFHLYRFPMSELADIERCWTAAMPKRLTFSDLVGVWHGAEHGEGVLVHVWAYPSLDDFTRTRTAVLAADDWPPSLLDIKSGGPGYSLTSQENKILVPAPFYPRRLIGD